MVLVVLGDDEQMRPKLKDFGGFGEISMYILERYFSTLLQELGGQLYRQENRRKGGQKGALVVGGRPAGKGGCPARYRIKMASHPLG